MKTKLVSSNISFFACRTALLLMLFIAGGNVVLAQDTDFPASNLDKVRTRYKTLIYDPTNWTAQLHLFTNGPEVAGHTGAKPSELAANGYVRWYLEDKDGHYVDFQAFRAYNTGTAYFFIKNGKTRKKRRFIK